MSKFVQGYALVIGVGADLPNTVTDAKGLSDVLKDPERCAYPAEQVQTLTGDKAKRTDILDALDQLAAKSGADATVIFYFSGHGYEISTIAGKAYFLMPYGYSVNALTATALSGSELMEKLKAIPAQKMLMLLDCCHAGGLENAKAPGATFTKAPLPAEATTLLAQGNGRVIIASSQADELSYAGEPYSEFTQALLEALTGAGASKSDGYVRAADLAMYARETVPSQTNGQQHPVLHFEQADNFVVAYYAAGEKQPKGLPLAAQRKAKSEMPYSAGPAARQHGSGALAQGGGVAAGQRGVAIGGNAVGSTIVTGDGNRIERSARVFDQRGQTVHGPQTNIAGDQYLFAAGIQPAAPVELPTALARLAELPSDHIPDAVGPPPGSWMPLSANPLFVGRQAELAALAAGLRPSGGAVVLTGLGGVGKSQLASTFVHRYGQYFLGGVFWLSFADPAAVPTEIAQCAAWLADLPAGVTHLPLPDQVQRVRRAWQSPLPRLLVFDNCEDPALFAAWRPTGGGCRLLITSRRARWSHSQGVTLAPVGILPRPQSVALLARFAPSPDLAWGEISDSTSARHPPQTGEGWGGVEGWSEDILAAIAAELGDLPLALHMAGSYLAQAAYDLTPAAYLAQLRTPALLDHLSLQSGDFSPTGHELHVARTFALSLARLAGADETDARARRLLACAACFAPGEALPRGLLRAAAGLAGDEAGGEAAAALGRLVNLGLLEEESGGALRLHRLLQLFVVNALKEELAGAGAGVEASVLEAANRLNNAGDPRPLLAWQVHLRHVTARAMSRLDQTAAGLCNTLGFHLQMTGDYAGARPYYERALAIRLQVLGEQHPDTASSLNNLGALLQATGDYAGARPYFERALVIRLQVLGEQHPDTARSLNNLGFLLQATGDYAGARPYYERALAINEAVLGEQHPDTASSLNNLGALLRATGDYAGARPYYERALAIRLQVLGEQHPDTASSLNNLGALLQATGDYAGARPYFERALVIRLQVLGEQHPDTARSLNNLGFLLQATGDYAGARPYYERALAINEAVLGEQHPDTASSLNNLGALLRATGDYAGARPYFERALVIRLQVLGEQHPDTARSLNNLGILAYYTGDKVAAHAYLERALAILDTLLGANHPDTQQTRQSLATVRAELAAAVEPEVTLAHLLDLVVQARHGNHTLSEQLYNNFLTLSVDTALPSEMQALYKVLVRILIGINNPDLAALPAELADAVQTLLNQLRK